MTLNVLPSKEGTRFPPSTKCSILIIFPYLKNKKTCNLNVIITHISCFVYFHRRKPDMNHLELLPFLVCSPLRGSPGFCKCVTPFAACGCKWRNTLTKSWRATQWRAYKKGQQFEMIHVWLPSMEIDKAGNMGDNNVEITGFFILEIGKYYEYRAFSARRKACSFFRR